MNNKLWLYFIMLQPFLDVATNFMVKYTETPITIGIIVRMAMLLLALFVVTMYFHREKMKRMLIVNLSIYGFAALNLLVNAITKEPFNLFIEVQFLAKAIYPFQLFFVFYILLKTYQLKKEQIAKFLTWNLIFLSLFVIVPSQLGLAFESYGIEYEGTIGWFNSANEVGAVIAFVMPIVIWGLYKEYVKWLGVIAIILSSYTAYLVGTKVSLGSVLVVLLFSVLFIAYKNKFRFDKSLITTAVPMIFLFAGFNQSPAMNNVEAVEEVLVQKQASYENKEANYAPEQVVEVTEVQRLKEKSHPRITQILSSRDVYVLMHGEMYAEAPLIRQVIGMGYASEYPKKPKVTEMDFFDYFYSFGILGALLTIGILIRPLFETAKRLWRDIRTKGLVELDFFLLLALTLLMGISFIAGHVLFTPTVSIYLALGLALLFYKNEPQKKNSI